jgi:phenylacetate-CoA ligase
MSLKEDIGRRCPHLVQNFAISLFNTYQYKVRHGGNYQKYREYFLRFSNASLPDIESEQRKRLNNFLSKSVLKSKWYSRFKDYQDLSDFDILLKRDVIENLPTIATVKEKEAVINFTGGTTGASMKVLYTKDNIQERNALLDHFRAQYGYKLGKKCAWFSGKSIIEEKDLLKGICHKDDYINRIRFFSTFHITDANFDVYWTAFCKFAPEFLVGFPSSVYELCFMAVARGLKLENTVKAFFPTAETLLPIHREVIHSVLGCKIADQYASSEGAPFILECIEGSLHIHPLTGVFEIIDDNMQSAQAGEILVTSFTTEGTPLIRYRIGDRIALAPKEYNCACGSVFPVVKAIEGRSTDYISTPTNGKINYVNITNSTKGVAGIIQFQVIQNELEKVEVLIVTNKYFDKKQQEKFHHALSERFGVDVSISINVVDSIPKEKSGKFRVVKNNIES